MVNNAPKIARLSNEAIDRMGIFAIRAMRGECGGRADYWAELQAIIDAGVSLEKETEREIAVAQITINLSIGINPNADERGNYWVTMTSPNTHRTYVSAVTPGPTDAVLRQVMADRFLNDFLAEVWEEVERRA